MKKSAGYRSVSVPEERLDEFFDVVQWAFVGEWLREDRQDYVDALPVERARAVEVTDEHRGTPGTLAGVHASFGTEMVVPGGRRVPTAGLSWLGVHPGHRRRGLMTTMIHDHFERSLARGESVSVLYAMEAPIYARFGYGMGSQTVKAEIPRGAKMWDVDGADELTVRLERASFERHDALVAGLQARLSRPGTVLNAVGSGRNARFTDPVGNRRGMEKWRIAIVEDRGEPVAYAFFRRHARSSVGIHDGVCQVREHGSLTPAAAQRLWQTLTDFDLVETTMTENLATDDPLLHQLKDPRGVRSKVIDNLWVRLLDVPTALAAREYMRDCDVVVQLTDKHVPANAGTWRIAVTGGEATVTRTDDAPDLTMDVRHLSQCYLGGTSMESLAAAGLVREHTAGRARELAVAMLSPVAPLANWDF
ncbi:GNAT family N-acetyltransferase [Demequina sp. SYSU T00039]|uniref:GNAT family N-acetyltransferase n=1 Tax=Demequina lignilytica TaxID=3051663 RepID=A0AAW7M4C9_9MICO|nr:MULTISPECIES: GNAT family N-acetyltransferase [unclassified Demequina]MDN4479250.1 GNAT family N-acetyltransferase [Demequina sp. SYSU T00039-1]MDN4487568.1 GNAT family N-acetyltransferase [Demequina sp. SYSU T00039]